MAEVENLNPSTTKEWLMHINSRIDVLVTNQLEQADCQSELSKKMDTVITSQSTQDVRIDNLEKRVNGWSLTNSIGVVVAAILALFGLKG
jgi:recombination DNA repair RAD52 pathway protein